MDTIIDLFSKLSENEKMETLSNLQNEQINYKNKIKAELIIFDGKKQNDIYDLIENDHINTLLENRSVKFDGHIVIYNEHYRKAAENFYKKHNPYRIDTQQLALNENECDLLNIKYPAFI